MNKEIENIIDDFYDYVTKSEDVDFGTLKRNSNNYDKLKSYIINLQQRIDKAIEYIKNNEYIDFYTTRNIQGKTEVTKSKPLIYKEPILSILKGENNE